MKTRTTFKTVSFAAPFSFRCLDEELPAGEYTVETDSELLEGVSFPAYRRLATLIHLPVKAGPSGNSRLLSIDPEELEGLLTRDSEAAARTALTGPPVKPLSVVSNGTGSFDDGDRPQTPHPAGSPV